MINPDEPIDNGAQTDVVIEPTQVDQPQPVSQPMDGNGKADTISDAVRRARESIPVGDHGVTPTVYEHQITIAKDKARAHLLLPMHMRNNAPVMAALVGFVARFDLEPVMFASQTYVVPGSDRLSFTSQAFGAILYASKLLIGRLKYEYRGEGDDLTCRVIGRFREDPDTIYDSTTPPLRQVKKHSPLWRDDPEQQLGYYAQRRWMRKYTPDVCMGMYTREEQLELDEFRRARGESVPLSADRLGQLDTGEGWGEGAHVDMDLASIAPEQPEFEREPELEPELPRRRPPPQKPIQRKPPGRRKVAPIAVKTRQATPARPPVAKPRGRPPTSAVVKAAVKRAEQPPPRRVAPMPRWLDYVTETEAWVKKLSADEAPQAEGRWEGERAERDKAQVPIGERSRLRALLDRKLAQFAPKA